MAHSRCPKLRPSRLFESRYGTILGCKRRKRGRKKLVLELDGNYRRVGRLGRLLRSGRADEARPSGRPGFRVPMLVISPYVPPNEISHTVYGFGSIIRFIEDTWSLGRLGTTDVTCTSIANMFNFSRPQRKFEAIPARYSRSYFLHQAPSGLPVDTE